jgi:hydrophobic/amphiphilic exporter-1 (mainly G- bacteria), HAE1 family
MGITVASGMLASTCIAVLFVPSFFVVLQRLGERRRKPASVTQALPQRPISRLPRGATIPGI